MERCIRNVKLCSAWLGVLFGVSGFVVFFFVYHNLVAGTWCLLSGVFAAICFHLHYLHLRNRITEFYLQEELWKLCDLGMFVFLIAAGFFCWYIFITIYWHIPMMPVSGSSVISAVWAFMTAKWGLFLYLAARQYVRINPQLILDEENS